MALPPDEGIVSEAVRSLEEFFEVAERLLHQNDYMAGNDFSLIDIYYIPVVQRLFDCGHGDLITTRAAVSAWWDRCTNRPAVRNLLDGNKRVLAAVRESK